MKKATKIIILFICICVIVFAGLKFFGISNSATNDFSDGESYQIASWESKKSENGCVLTLTFYSNNTVNIDCTLESSTNAFYNMDDLVDLDYKSRIIRSNAEYSDGGDCYASIVPNDCTGVIIDDNLYEVSVAKVIVENSEITFKYVVADLNHMDEHSVSLIDENGKEHKII
ncbi:MAG: hypothetical protein LIO62_08460 [Clostridiales bacterium]|nr:hypothetical protein [Clostridiales bacterium]